MGLVPQPTIEDIGAPGFVEGTGAEGRGHLAVSLTYTLWRNPEDRADPANLKELDSSTQGGHRGYAAWPRLTWLVEFVEMMRYLNFLGARCERS